MNSVVAHTPTTTNDSSRRSYSTQAPAVHDMRNSESGRLRIDETYCVGVVPWSWRIVAWCGWGITGDIYYIMTGHWPILSLKMGLPLLSM